jgi:hypothetical protein
MVLHVVQHEEAGDGIEVTFKLRMRHAQIANSILDRSGGCFLPGQLDQPWREIDAGHPGSPGSQDAGEVPLAAAGVEHILAGHVAKLREQRRQDAERIAHQVILLTRRHVGRVLVGVLIVGAGPRRCRHRSPLRLSATLLAGTVRAGVHRHPYADGADLAPRLGLESALGIQRRRDRIRRANEHGMESVAHRLDDMAVVLADRRP